MRTVHAEGPKYSRPGWVNLAEQPRVNFGERYRLALLDKYIVNLEKEFAGVPLDRFQKSWAMQRMTERSLQVMVEIVVDIAQRIIALKGEGPVSSYKGLLTQGSCPSCEPDGWPGSPNAPSESGSPKGGRLRF